MPTGYTAILTERDDVTFREFATRCLRGMGVTILMRDDPLDAPIPEKFEASTWNLEELEKAKACLAELESLSPGELAEKARENIEKSRAADRDYLERGIKERQRYERMLSMVDGWTPPTPDHVEFKEFMRAQLVRSCQFLPSSDTVDESEITEADIEKEVVGMKSRAIRNVEYHSKAHAEEVARTNERNEYLRQFRQSLDDYEQANQ